MKTVQAFADLGLSVVPMDGVISRDINGKKKIPKFRGAWKELYLDTPYDPVADGEPAALTGAFITGERSGAISIDCDNTATFEMFKALDPENQFVFLSKDKPEGGGSIIYRLTDEYKEIPPFRIHDIVAGMQLDYQTNDLLQFLPTSGNRSKVEWKGDTLSDLPELREPPSTIISYLKVLQTLHAKSKVLLKDGNITQGAVSQHYKHLAPFIETFVKGGKFAPELFRILTPKEGGFRDIQQYKEELTLHPDNVPDGMGNAYLSSIAGVLVYDNSVSPKLFKAMMHAVNNLWSDPYPNERLETLIRHELNREKWVYDPDWQEKVYVILTEYNTLVNVFYDPLTRIYYALDNKFGMSTFPSIDMLPKHLNSIVQGGRRFKAAEVYDYLDKKQTIMSPLESYGDLPPTEDMANLARYNLFARSEAYDVLLHPDRYRDKYEGKVPQTTISFFEHLIPDEVTRDYVLRFVLTKLLTLKFSEVVLYFLGKQGAGKNLFVDWLDLFTQNNIAHSQSSDYKLMVEVELETFLTKYNLWIMNALFANLDEYGEKTATASDDKRVLAQLKSYSGKSGIQLRTMHSDPVPAEHKCTFILTANENRLAPDLEDRRLVLIETPEALGTAKYIKEAGGKSVAIATMFNEMPLWAYYWATKYKKLSMDEYRTPPDTEFKRKLILRHLPASKRIAAAVYGQSVTQIVSLFENYDMYQDLLNDAKYGALAKPTLVRLFETMTVGSMARKAMLDASFRELQLKFTKMRFGPSRQTYGIAFNELKKWSSQLQMTDGVLLSADVDGDDFTGELDLS